MAEGLPSRARDRQESWMMEDVCSCCSVARLFCVNLLRNRITSPWCPIKVELLTGNDHLKPCIVHLTYGWTANSAGKLGQLLAGDHLARGSMKTAANCVSLCESQRLRYIGMSNAYCGGGVLSVRDSVATPDRGSNKSFYSDPIGNFFIHRCHGNVTSKAGGGDI